MSSVSLSISICVSTTLARKPVDRHHDLTAQRAGQGKRTGNPSTANAEPVTGLSKRAALTVWRKGGVAHGLSPVAWLRSLVMTVNVSIVGAAWLRELR